MGVIKNGAAFIGRSTQPEWARQFLTVERCEILVGFDSLQFLTASIGTALTPDYWPDQRERNLRSWAKRIKDIAQTRDGASSGSPLQE